MGKITKRQLKLHEQTEDLLWGSEKKLTQEQVAFCLEESCSHENLLWLEVKPCHRYF